ncbi:MAG TPA: hypothetical protein VE621_12825 [Bryobacteraceae bacterium]|jgi:hypothetical protein|nr:hypothetical protein [Bryobacteraceae bacterium]
MMLPTLKTGAFAQYPLEDGVEYSTAVLTHIDGSEQRFRQYRSKRRRWSLRYQDLGDGEIGILRSFWKNAFTTGEPFEMPNPKDGSVLGNCYFESQTFSVSFTDEDRCSLELIVEQRWE